MPEIPPLRAGRRIQEIHCLIRTLADVPEPDNWLGEGERLHLSTLRFPKRRDDWRLGRWTAKLLISLHLDMPSEPECLSELEIRAATDGAPQAFFRGFPAPLSLSISHSSGTSLCAVASPPVAVGCDLELVRPREPGFAEDYFAGEELALLRQAPPSRQAFLSTLLWSAKESALKSLREGLRRDTRSVIVSIDPREQKVNWNAMTVRCVETGRTFPGWWRPGQTQVQTITADQPTSEPIEARFS